MSEVTDGPREETPFLRATRIAGEERALAERERRLAESDEQQALVGSDGHRALHGRAARIHREAAQLHMEASLLQEQHALEHEADPP